MKYIIERHKFSTNEIKDALKKSINIGDIKMNIPIDDFIDKNLTKLRPELGTFEYLVQSGFISMGDEQRMGEYIKRFNELGLDVSKLEKLFPKYQEYLNFPMDPPEEYDYFMYHTTSDGEHLKDDESHTEYKRALDNWHKQSDKYEKIRQEFNDEVRKLMPLAKEKLGI